MKKIPFMMMVGLILIASTPKNDNPFFQAFPNKYGIPPFDLIESRHFMPAFEKGIKQQLAEIEVIVNNSEAPTFANTVAALDYSGELLTKVSAVFSNLNITETNSELQQIAREISPILTAHQDNIRMNDRLFRRIQTLYNKRETLGLTGEQNRLLEIYYQNFVHSGADLEGADRERMREINRDLGMAELTFAENVRAEINSFRRFVTDEAELVGLTSGILQSAAAAAEAAGRPGEWLFTIHRASFIPVLRHGENRELRRELFTAFSMQGQNDNEYDNRELISKIVSLRVERAQLLGFETHAHYALYNTMAKTPERVMEFLHELWSPVVAQAKIEAAELQRLMDEHLPGETIQPWDWWFYTERLREERYALDDDEIRPFFKMENVRQGAFDVSTRLFGVHFEQIEGMPVYHPDVDVFRVTDADGSFIGILFTDYFPRPGKRNGAWKSAFRRQFKRSGVNYHPIITNVGNFTPPTDDRPSLLTFDEVRTLFHEIGHALHGLLSNVTYPTLSGTRVTRDFVELPAQLMPHWSLEPELLKSFAFHYRTGEVIPDELIERIQRVRTFNVGFDRTERLASAFLDMDWHMLTTTEPIADVLAFEKESMERIGLIPQIIPRWPSTYFNHIFGGIRYDARYYSYTWAAVLDADAFEAFAETGDVFNQEVGMRFRREILERGNTKDPVTMYFNFRGAEPNPDALLRRWGLK
jgi:peptidyl-dipeptidase Dcp